MKNVKMLTEKLKRINVLKKKNYSNPLNSNIFIVVNISL